MAVRCTKKENPQIAWLRRARRERRGTGIGRDYLPWIQVRRFDLNSRGRSHVVYNPMICRQHHLLSDLELRVLLLLVYARPQDIREQFPLALGITDEEFANDESQPIGTVEIAEGFGFRHPAITRACYRVMTTDFLVDTAQGPVAIYAKYHRELENGRAKRLGELLLIAKEYWRVRKVTFIEVTDLDLPPTVTRWILWAWDALKTGSNQSDRRRVVQLLRLTDPCSRMKARIEQISKWMGLSSHECIKLLKHAVILREIEVDFNYPPDLSRSWNVNAVSSSTELPVWHFLSKTRRNHD